MALVRDFDDRPPAADTRAMAAPFGAGAIAGLVAGIPMLALLTASGELASHPTVKPGVDSGLVTMPNAVAQFTFSTGIDQFGEGYRWLTYPGIGLHLIAATLLGAAGAALIATVLGRRPRTLPTVVAGVAYGTLLQIVLLLGLVDLVQDADTVETSVPIWAWWAGHVLYGALLGAIGAPLMRRAADSADALAAAG